MSVEIEVRVVSVDGIERRVAVLEARSFSARGTDDGRPREATVMRDGRRVSARDKTLRNPDTSAGARGRNLLPPRATACGAEAYAITWTQTQAAPRRQRAQPLLASIKDFFGLRD